MPISLLQIAKEMGQAAVVVDHYIEEAYRARVLENFTCDSEGVYRPVTNRFQFEDARDVLIARLSMGKHTRLEPEEIKLSIESDVHLEGRQFTIPQRQPIRIEKGTGSNGRLGLDLRSKPTVGSFAAPDDEAGTSWLLHGEAIPLQRVTYHPNGETLMVGFPGDFEHLRLLGNTQLDLGVPAQDVSARLTLDCNSAFRWDDQGGWLAFKVPTSEMSWLAELVDGDTFEIALFDTGTHREIENRIGSELAEQGTIYDIMVTLNQGMEANAAKISLECSFRRREVTEGVAQVTDRLNRELAQQLT